MWLTAIPIKYHYSAKVGIAAGFVAAAARPPERTTSNPQGDGRTERCVGIEVANLRN